MININTKIIILAIIASFLAVFIVFALINLNSNNAFRVENLLNFFQKSTSNQLNANKSVEGKNTRNYLQELKNNHPEYSESQIEFYNATASQGAMVPCLNRADENFCILSVAYISRNSDFCSEITDPKTEIECATPIVADKAVAEVEKCGAIKEDDFKTQCLVNIFQDYQQPADCSSFQADEIRNICESVAYFQMAKVQGIRTLCANIKIDFLKNFCTKIIK